MVGCLPPALHGARVGACHGSYQADVPMQLMEYVQISSARKAVNLVSSFAMPCMHVQANLSC